MPKLSDIHNEFVELLPDAAFVTADCELSGLTEKTLVTSDLGDYLRHQRNGASTFTMLQVGLCIAVYDHESGPGSWMLYPYNFYLYPAEDEVMHFHSGTVKWLKDNGFDFMRWIDDGLPYIRLSAANTMTDKTKRSKSACRWGIQKLFEAIKQHRIPLVVHNGLMDLYHIYDKFVGPLPQDPDDIVKAFYSWFGLGVYDTKHVARYLHDNNLCDLKNLFSLDCIYQSFQKKFQLHRKMRVCRTVCNLDYTVDQNENKDPDSPEKPAQLNMDLLHEAGFDATVTAMVFAAEVSLLQKKDGIPPHYVPHDYGEHSDFFGPHFSDVISRVNLHDRIADGYLDLGKGMESEKTQS